MSDTQKTTKGAREAATASQEDFKAWAVTPEGQTAIINELERRGMTPQEILTKMEEKRAETEPRYTVELTTEGWQIKDNISDQIFPDVWGTKIYAKQAAQRMNVADTAEGQGRR